MTNNINIKNNIKITAFGDEDMNKISDEVYKRILNKGFQSVPQLIKYVHFNDQIPENHNIYISNSRDNTVKIHDGSAYILSDQTKIVETLYDQKSGHLEDKYEELVDVLNEFTKRKFQRFLDNKDNAEHMNKIHKDIKLLLYNYRNIPIETQNKNKVVK